VRQAATFFLSALTPIEKTHRVAMESNGRMERLSGAMRLRGGDLVAVRQLLRGEIARRRSAEQALKKAAEHYTELLGKSRRMQEHLRDLSHKILATQETERERISRELHDEVGQTLTGINVILATLNRETTLSSKGLKQKIAATQRLVERSMLTVHRFARELRPPLLDDLGLIPALHAFMKSFTKRTRIRVDFKTFAEVEQLSPEKRTALFRVAQEALTNVLKHAEASVVNVTILREKGIVRMEVTDNGKSFDVRRVMFARRITRLGLLGMRERMEMVGGTLTVESERGRGTIVRAAVPFRKGK
jgi:signal transduction histidine kinase